MTQETTQEIREKINDLLKEFYREKEQSKEFIPGKTSINYAGAIFDYKEATAFISSFLDGWFGTGKKTDTFEKGLAEFIGMKHGAVTNSGSSANLLAISALCSRQMENRLNNGEEIITSAAAFPTTVNPIIQNNLEPIFIDPDLGTYNPNVDAINEAISKKTRAIFLAHTLGNPNDMKGIMDLAEDHNLFVIEDTCDALGSEFGGKKCGSFGTMSTYSFYPAHHITMGEGGAVLSNNIKTDRVIRSIRDWGRDCFCKHDEKSSNGACQKRFDFKFKNLPEGYDHKYVYSNIGYNLKPLEFQGAFGIEQLKRLPAFIDKRNSNFDELNTHFRKYEDYFILPKSLPEAKPCWFSFPLTVREDAPFTRLDFVKFLESNLIQTRLLFSGNILRHPAYDDLNFKVVGNLINADAITERTFFLGVFPGIDKQRMDYMKLIIDRFFEEKIRK